LPRRPRPSGSSCHLQTSEPSWTKQPSLLPSMVSLDASCTSSRYLKQACTQALLSHLLPSAFLLLFAGPEFEHRILANERNNVKFNFLVPTDPYHAYYQMRVGSRRVYGCAWCLCMHACACMRLRAFACVCVRACVSVSV